MEKNIISKFCQTISEIDRLSRYIESERKIHSSGKPNRLRGTGDNSFESNYDSDLKYLKELQEKFNYYFVKLPVSFNGLKLKTGKINLFIS